MIDMQNLLKNKYTKTFIDLCDVKLNSNTYIFQVNIDDSSKSLKQVITEYIKSKCFKEDILIQNAERNHLNYGIYDKTTRKYSEYYFSGEFYIPNFYLKISKRSIDEIEKELTYILDLDEKDSIVKLFLSQIIKENYEKNNTVNGFCVQPDFLHFETHKESADYFPYFSGSSGDRCFIFTTKQNAYVLLMNGDI